MDRALCAGRHRARTDRRLDRQRSDGSHLWAEAFAAIDPLARSSDDPQILASAASLALLRGDDATAHPMLLRLAGMGYRAPDFVALLASRQLPYPLNLPIAQRIAESMR